MSITQTFHLNLIPEQGPTVVHCDQYDEGTGRLIIKLYDGDVAYSPTGSATIQGKKPDGHGFEYAASLSGNIVTADLTKQMTAVAGPVRCQVVVRESDDRTGTFAFILQVQKSALPDDTEMSDSDYQLIEQALDAAEDAEAWAVGERGGVPVGPTDPTYNNNAEYWAYQASQYAQGGLIFKGSVAFASIPTTGMVNGDMYNITDDFTTDSRFIEGAGKEYPAGTDIAYVDSLSKWDVLSAVKIGTLDDLNDVDITTPSSGDFLGYNSTAHEWQNMTPDIDDLGDVSISSPSDGQVLKYDANSGEWVNGTGSAVADLNDLTDVTITTPSDGQALLYDATNQIWKNGNVSGGGGDYVGLYGMTEIQSSDGQGTTTINLDDYFSVGNYYCEGKAKLSMAYYRDVGSASTAMTHEVTNANFLMYVRSLPSASIIQDLYEVATGKVIHFRRLGKKTNNVWAFAHWRLTLDTGSSSPLNTPIRMDSSISDVYVTSPSNGDALIYQNGWRNKPVNRVTTLSVDLTGWTSDTTSQSGTTLYKKQISVNHVYVESPTVDIGSSGVLPTAAEQESYNLLQYVTVDDTVPCLYLYASAIPTTAFYIKVEGVD